MDKIKETTTAKTASEISYEFDVERWNEQDIHKEYVQNNTVGLKVGHGSKSRRYITRTPANVVKNARCNSLETNRDKLIVQIFILELFRNSKRELRRTAIMGYTARVDGKRESYLLTSGYNKLTTYDDNERLRCIAVVDEAHTAAHKLTDSVFSNQLGRNKRDYVRGIIGTIASKIRKTVYVNSEQSAW